jgi:hypothetical protein
MTFKALRHVSLHPGMIGRIVAAAPRHPPHRTQTNHLTAQRHQPLLAKAQCLTDLLAQIPDPRHRRGRRYPLAGLLAIGIVAVTADPARSPRSASGPPMPAPTS